MNMCLPKVSHEAVDALLASCQLPKTATFTYKQLIAQYHSIYMLTLADGSDVVLRVAGNHLSHRKTINEIAVMRWVEQNTTIPVPKVLAYDASTNNPLGCEYTLLEKVPGVCADTVYAGLDPVQKLHIIRQIADFVLQLHQKPFRHIGGLALARDGSVIAGPVVEVRSWQSDDVRKAWSDDETIDTLNASGPFETWTAYSISKLERCLYALQKHPELAWVNKKLGKRVRDLIKALEESRDDLDGDAYVLAHKDMHFSNIMCDPETANITAVLDWEFSQVTPLPSWNPGNFLLLCPADDADIEQARTDQQQAIELFNSECRARGAVHLVDTEKNDQQEAMEEAVELLGWIVRSVPTGKYVEIIPTWMDELNEALEEFDV